MAKKLYADGKTGKVAIYNPANPAAFSNPLGNLADVFFHSDLDYVGVAKIIDVTITHPARGVAGTAPNNSYAQPNFPAGANPLAHNLGYIPFAIMFVGNNMMPANSQIQWVGTSFRTVALQLDASNVYIYEQSWVYRDPLPAMNMTYRILLFRQMSQAYDPKAFYAKDDQFKAGFGKLNTDYNYLRYSTAGPYYFSKGRTADCSNGSFRIITANGGWIERPPYNGGFGGVPGIGVTL